jgi:hypothetical protein
MQSTTRELPSVLPEDLALALFDQEARRIARIPSEESLARWDAGESRDIEDAPEGRELAYLILLIPFGRRIA